jgi:Protein of unknown function (DUF3592)
MIYGLFALVGVLIIVGCLAWGLKTYQFINNSFSAQGIVVALNAGGSHPQIKFITSEGKEIKYSQNGLIFGYKIGDQITVLYDPQNPHEASVNAPGALWGFNLLSFILGVCFTGIGFFKFLNSP